MKTKNICFLAAFFYFLTSCSHTAIENFQTIQVGQDKESVLNKIGSPLRSRRNEGKDIWTYRFYQNTGYIYKELTFENQKIISIEDSKQTQFEEIEKKERKIEEALRNTKKEKNPRVLQKKSPNKSSNTEFLEQTSTPQNEEFVPVE